MNKGKINKGQVVVFVALGILFLGIGIYKWAELNEIEQGLREGGLSIILLKIYELAGKWGVAGFYSIFSFYCFWRAYKLSRLSQKNESTEENENQND